MNTSLIGLCDTRLLGNVEIWCASGYSTPQAVSERPANCSECLTSSAIPQEAVMACIEGQGPLTAYSVEKLVAEAVIVIAILSIRVSWSGVVGFFVFYSVFLLKLLSFP
jgi:hypothetical protein